MKKIFQTLFIIVAVISFANLAHAESHKGKKIWGIAGLGFYEISNYESLYVNFATSNLKAAGAGFKTYFEYGVGDQFYLEGSAGYARVTYSNKFFNQIKQNFFLIDILGKYYFMDAASRIQPYVGGGVGGLISSRSAAPLLDIAVGSHFMLTDQFSIRLQAMYKTAIIHNRAEGSLGIAYHF